MLLAGVEWLWTNSCDILEVRIRFSGSGICSSIFSDWNSGWLSMRFIHNSSAWVGNSGWGMCLIVLCAPFEIVLAVLAPFELMSCLVLLACCLNMLSSCVMASLVTLETGIAPVIASDTVSATLINTSDGVKVGIVRYLYSINTELQTHVPFGAGI